MLNFVNFFDFTWSRINFNNIISLSSCVSPKTPIFSLCEQKKGSFSIKASVGYWQWCLVAQFISWFCIFIPGHPLTITACCHEGVVLLIKCYLVNGVYVSLIIFFYSVTLETEISRVNLFQIIKIDIDNTASAFNASNSISFSITKAWNWTSCIFEWALLYNNWIKISLCYLI